MKKISIIIISIALLTGCSLYSEEAPVIPGKDIGQESEIEESQGNGNEDTENNENNENNGQEKESVMAPDFELEALDGSTIRLSETRDKNVILNFWYTGCSFCVAEMPDLQKLQDTYQGELLLLAINVGEEREEIQEFMDENQLTFTVLLDEKMDLTYDYGIRSFPTTIAVNKKGEVIAGYVGMLTYEQMEELYGFFE